MRRYAIFSILAVALTVSGCSADGATRTADARPSIAPASQAPGPRAIVIDTDLDQSDISAIAILLRDPDVDVLAITIEGTGLVHCQGGRRVMRYLLAEIGASDVPSGCGREDGGPDARPFPDEWRVVADAGYGLPVAAAAETGDASDAVDVLSTAIEASPTPPLLVTLGPLTNLEDAFAADPTLAGHVAGIHAMLGTIRAPGNVFVDGFGDGDPLEWNAFADPSAVSAVFAMDLPIDLVPLDATDDVPVPTDLADRLRDDRRGAGADLTYELLLRHPDRLRADTGQQLWDELAALAVSDPGLVTWETAPVVVGDGGRLTSAPTGRAVRYASAADRPAVESALLDALRRGGPRVTPFDLAGSIEARWDGTACSLTGAASSGVYGITYQGPVGTGSGLMIARVEAPHAWTEVEEFLRTVDLTTNPAVPPWLVLVGQLGDETGDGAPVASTLSLEAGLHAPICLVGAWPDVTLHAGRPLEISGG